MYECKQFLQVRKLSPQLTTHLQGLVAHQKLAVLPCENVVGDDACDPWRKRGAESAPEGGAAGSGCVRGVRLWVNLRFCLAQPQLAVA